MSTHSHSHSRSLLTSPTSPSSLHTLADYHRASAVQPPRSHQRWLLLASRLRLLIFLLLIAIVVVGLRGNDERYLLLALPAYLPAAAGDLVRWWLNRRQWQRVAHVITAVLREANAELLQLFEEAREREEQRTSLSVVRLAQWRWLTATTWAGCGQRLCLLDATEEAALEKAAALCS